MDDLEPIFLAFCDSIKKGSRTATDKTIKKICTDCKIYMKGMDTNRVDIQFKSYTGNAKKDVNYKEFCEFLEGKLTDAYMAARKLTREEAISELKCKIISSSPASHSTTKASTDSVTSRLTDVKTYTGSHKERFDPETGTGKGKEGREYLVDAKSASGYVQAYKQMGKYDEK